MNCYDDQLRQLQAQCARKRKLEAAAAELRAQQEAYTARAQELKQQLLEKQEDVDRLEGWSLTAFLCRITGKMDETLTQEKKEACAAGVRYNTAIRELAEIKEDLGTYEAELKLLQDCGHRYAALLQEKTQAVKATGGSTAEKILKLEEHAACLEDRQRELEEALCAGQAALDIAQQVADSLRSAENWGTWDLVGGGLVTDLVKHSRLDSAQASVEALQARLRRFRTELADVTISADFQVRIDGFLQVADYLFDGIFADWAVLDRIHQSQNQIQHTQNQICRVLDDLQTLSARIAGERADIQHKIEDLVSSVSM